MKKIFKTVFIATLLMLLIGCNGKNEDSKETLKDEKKVTLKLFIPGYTDPTFGGEYDATLEAFAKANPDIKIEVIGEGWGKFQKMMSMIQADEAPDIMIMGSRRLNQMSNLETIIQLDDYLTEERRSEYIDSVLNTGKVNGKQFGLPVGFSSRALYYRKDLIKDAPKTWGELIEVSKKVEKENPGIKGFGVPAAMTDSTIAQLYNFIYQNKGKAMDENGNILINTPEIVEAVQYYTDLYTKYNVILNPVELKRSNLSGLFKNGQIAMFISGPWEKNVMQLEADNDKTPYGVALLPKGVQHGQTLVTDSITISSQTKNKEAAWKFVEFFTSPKYQNSFDKTVGFFPIFKEESNAERYNQKFLKPFVEMIQYGQPEPNPLVWEEFNEILVKAVQKIILGEATTKEALDKAQEQLDRG